MMQQNIYLYGTFHDTTRARLPRYVECQTSGIIIYVNPSDENSRVIGSLEGFFVSGKPLPTSWSRMTTESGSNPVVERAYIREFEQRHHGKFIPFKEKE